MCTDVNPMPTKPCTPQGMRKSAHPPPIPPSLPLLSHLHMSEGEGLGCQGPAFDLESKQVGGRVFTWLGCLFAPRASLGGPIAALGPSREAVARSALFNLLSTNPDVVGTVIDQCYSNQAPLARGFFQARTLPPCLAEISIFFSFFFFPLLLRVLF